jgi:hypothetical protein
MDITKFRNMGKKNEHLKVQNGEFCKKKKINGNVKYKIVLMLSLFLLKICCFHLEREKQNYK